MFPHVICSLFNAHICLYELCLDTGWAIMNLLVAHCSLSLLLCLNSPTGITKFCERSVQRIRGTFVLQAGGVRTVCRDMIMHSVERESKWLTNSTSFDMAHASMPTGASHTHIHTCTHSHVHIYTHVPCTHTQHTCIHKCMSYHFQALAAISTQCGNIQALFERNFKYVEHLYKWHRAHGP